MLLVPHVLSTVLICQYQSMRWVAPPPPTADNLNRWSIAAPSHTALNILHTSRLQVRELIYREVLEYHPQMLADFLAGNRSHPTFLYPSKVDYFKRQFAHLESGGMGQHVQRGMHNGHLGQATSLPRERVKEFQHEAARYMPQQVLYLYVKCL